MIEDSLKRLASSEIITNKLDMIIEAFVSFYGEERRQEIENRLRNVLILKFTNTYTLSDQISNVKRCIFKEVYGLREDEFMFFNIDSLIRFLKKENTFVYDFIDNDVKKIIFGTSDISAEEALANFKNGKYSKLNEFLKKYDEIKSILIPYEKIVDNENLKAAKIREKYYLLLLNEFSEMIPQEEWESYKETNWPGPVMRSYFDNGLSNNGHCFDLESERKLNNSETPQYKIDSIIKDRLAFLKVHGYDYQTYEECLNDSKCKAFIKDAIQVCTRISKRKEELYKQLSVELVENLDDYKKCRKAIEEKHYVNKDDSLGTFVYDSLGVSCCEPNYVFDGEKIVMSPLVLINSGAIEPDCTIIHELNHAFEYHTVEVDVNGCRSFCGWDSEYFKFKQQQEHKHVLYSGITRKYELLNEYVNDRIAQEITDIMHEQGNYILENRRSNETSSYIMMRFLLEGFYSEFKETIIKSRSNGNIDYLYERLGKDNFEALNDLTNKFYKEYGLGARAGEAITDYNKNRSTENALNIKRYIYEKNKILNEMRIHLQNNEVETSKNR